MGPVVVADRVNFSLLGDFSIDLGQKLLNSMARCRRWIEEMTVPSAVLNAATPPLGASSGGTPRLVVPWRT